jgi:diadenosine tetraphosphatase ApaH/serine/threonine PP2A family protein phosphatase
MAALIDNRVFSVHGGLSPNAILIEKISLIARNEELPASGPLCDLCWSDPKQDADEWHLKQRGADSGSTASILKYNGEGLYEFCRFGICHINS